MKIETLKKIIKSRNVGSAIYGWYLKHFRPKYYVLWLSVKLREYNAKVIFRGSSVPKDYDGESVIQPIWDKLSIGMNIIEDIKKTSLRLNGESIKLVGLDYDFKIPMQELPGSEEKRRIES